MVLNLNRTQTDFFVVHVEIIGSPNKGWGRLGRRRIQPAQQCLSSNFLPKLRRAGLSSTQINGCAPLAWHAIAHAQIAAHCQRNWDHPWCSEPHISQLPVRRLAIGGCKLARPPIG